MRERELKVVDVPLGTIRPYEGNAKKHTSEQIDAVEASIREFGFSNPVLLWHNEGGEPEIIAGHARCKAAQNLGMQEVPAIFLDDLSDAQRRALTLADNQTTMMTGWDFDQLGYELDTLSGDFDMQDFGFDVDGMVDWGEVPELTEASYETPVHDMLTCPKCGHVDKRDHFKPVEK